MLVSLTEESLCQLVVKGGGHKCGVEIEQTAASVDEPVGIEGLD